MVAWNSALMSQVNFLDQEFHQHQAYQLLWSSDAAILPAPFATLLALANGASIYPLGGWRAAAPAGIGLCVGGVCAALVGLRLVAGCRVHCCADCRMGHGLSEHRKFILKLRHHGRARVQVQKRLRRYMSSSEFRRLQQKSRRLLEIGLHELQRELGGHAPKRHKQRER